MNDAQLRLYRLRWAEARRVLRARGMSSADTEVERKRWHLLIGAVYLRGPMAGQPKSSTVLTNAEIDRFLARCEAWKDEGALKRVMELDAMPERRALFACGPLFDLMGMPEGERAGYVAGIYHNVQRGRKERGEREFALHEMPDGDLQLVLVALAHTVAHKTGKAHGHPRTKHVGGWRARDALTHRVGSRKAGAEAEGGFGTSGVNRVFTDEDGRLTGDDPVYVEPQNGEPF